MHLCQFTPFSLRLGDRLVCYSRPGVMGIVNATPDSFYAGSRTRGSDAVKCRVEAMVAAGADMLDVGAYSSRPGADDVAPQEEIDRLGEAMSALRSVAPDIPVSVDTFRAAVAKEAVRTFGADIVNDVSGGALDDAMFDT
ncbi:MAG: dihydropteroate synthase, partial [Candidatus Amulumruptor sp.]|nr:dihydropteroate synthase [Candidatus Amulumruptor sp.]